MKHQTSDDNITERAALYALGAMSQREANAFEDHLFEGCQVCSEELKEFDMVVGALGLLAPAVTPRREARFLLIERIESESSAAADSSLIEKTVLIQKRGSERRFLLRADFLQWALATLFAILALVSFESWRRSGQTVRRMQEQLAAFNHEVEGLRSGIDAESRRVAEMEQINQILVTPGSRVIKLEGRSSSARIYWDTGNRRWAVTMDMPPAPEGKVYQLWFITPKAKVSAGVIESDQTGHGYGVLDIPSNIDHLIAAAVTLEPRGGSLQPTMPIYARGKIAD
ncbi:MAG: anti-sigma factor [Acidobacteriota bacterium]